MRADEAQSLHERACDPRVENVADDRHRGGPRDGRGRLAQRVEVEQRLRRVLMCAVTGVDDVGGRRSGDELRRPDVGWRTTITSGSYAPSVSAVSFRDSPLSTDEPAERTDIVSADRRFARQLEARERARRRLVEQVHDESAAQRRKLLDVALERAGEPARGAEDPLDVALVEVRRRSADGAAAAPAGGDRRRA